MAEVQQLRAIAPQLARQLGRRHALGEPAHDQDQLDGPPLGPLQGRPGVGVEDAPARLAAVIEDRGAVPVMDVQAVARPASRAGQTVGMEPGEELGVAGILIHQVGDGEVHGAFHFGRQEGLPRLQTAKAQATSSSPQNAPHEPKRLWMPSFSRTS